MPEEKKSNGSLVWGVVVVLIALAAIGGYKFMNKGDSALSDNNTEQTETPTVPEVTTEFKDGSYTVRGGYTSPAGPEEIDVTVVLANDTVTDVTVSPLATATASINWQTKFSEGVRAQVVGKKLTEVTLTKVSGSSLTPKGWNDAIAKIQVEARNTPEAI